MLVRSGRRRSLSGVVSWPSKDRATWGSLLPSSKKTANLLTLEEGLRRNHIKYCLPAYVDMHGVPKTKLVPVDHAVSMCEGSELFTGAALDGVPQDASDDEVCAVADAAVGGFALPYQRDVAWFPASLYLNGEAFEPCSRNIFARAAAKAKEAPFRSLMKLGVEAEFFVFRQGEESTPVSSLPDLAKPCYDAGSFSPFSALPDLDKPAYDVARLLDNLPWLDELVEHMQELGWGVYSFDHEDGTGQVEIDFDFCEAGEMCDRFVLLRTMANAVARKHGAYATWMPKPLGHRTGSGAHLNVSLHDFDSEANLFKDPNDPRGLGSSDLFYRFVAGVLDHLPAITAVACPTVNSYKRLVKQGSMSGFTWAPVYACYGDNNRTNAIRVPAPGRLELRLADPSYNPYLVSALVLNAGLDGIRRNLDPGDPHRDNMYLKSQSELDALGVKFLPRTLGEAVDAFAKDDLARDTFGPAMHDAWTTFKQDEWLSYLNWVSDWEKDRYLHMFV